MDRSDLLGLWRFVYHSTGRALLGFVGLFLVAVVLHTAWESIGTGTRYVVIAVVSLGLLLTAMRQARKADPVPVPRYAGAWLAGVGAGGWRGSPRS